jgi:alkanesulfonate monooxygenase SsuD/methylene tetrahydromethanopterin reductase-like flavin-dependent oxidoreductase (luciferase family)
LSVETARWCGSWADGLLTVAVPPERLRVLIDAFREGGGTAKPVVVQAKVAWAPTENEALAGAFDQWRTNVFDSTLMADLERVEQFEVAARHVRPDDVRASVFISSELAAHAAHLDGLVRCGVDQLFVHHVPRSQEGFIEAYGAKVLPELAG